MAENAAVKAIQMDPRDPEANRMLGAVLLLAGEHEDGIEHLQNAVDLNPNGADQLMWLGWGLTYVGRPLDALVLMKDAYARNPYPPVWYAWDLAWAQFNAGHYSDCIKTLRPRRQTGSSVQLLLTACYAAGGLLTDMLETARIFRATNPDFTLEKAAATQPFLYPRDLNRYLDSLRLAGIPE